MGISGQQEIAEQLTVEPEEFSLVVGGPLYQLLRRLNLITPSEGHVAWRVGVITAIAWLPLLVLTILEGRFAGNVELPFRYDVEVHARLLFALPLLILAELIVYVRMRALTSQFFERHIVTEAVRPAFNAAVSSVTRLRDSLLAEIALLLLVVFVGPHIWRSATALHSDTWYATVAGSELHFTPAGNYYAFVSVPIFQFILLRWYYRIAIWCRFLFQVSRLDLNLIAIHPDRCCGLGFLGTVVFCFSPILMAHSGIFAGYIANRIFHQGTTLPSYKFELLGLAVYLLAIVLGPLCVFAPKLNHARLAGLRTYGRLASDYVVGFADKWAQSGNVEKEPLMGSSDIQSLADLANSFEVVRGVRLVPFGKETIIRLVILIAVPLMPLAFTMFSPEELLKRLISTVL